MLDKSIRDKRDKLRVTSIGLRETSHNADYLKSIEIRDKQDEVYMKWQFYDNLIKNIERGNYEVQDQKNRKR